MKIKCYIVMQSPLAHPHASGWDCCGTEREYQLNFLLRQDVTHPERQLLAHVQVHQRAKDYHKKQRFQRV